MSLCRRLAAVGALLLLVALPAHATVLVAADLGELIAGSRAIVHGRVASVATQWLDGRRGVETIVTLSVEDALKGSAAESITFRVPGGQMGRYRSFMPGAPSFVEGDEIIVFLAGDGPAIPHVVGFSQGVYRVRTIAGERIVRPGAPASADATTRMPRGAAPGAKPLASFEAQVRALVVAGGAR